MTAPKVSIIMNCYNSAAYLREAMDSVFAQTFTDWEIIFWDDASTDESPKIAQSYGAKVKFFRGEKASSLGQARNWAIAKASGEYIAFLDCDDVWLPTKLEKQVSAFEKNPSAGLVFSDAYFFNTKEQWPVFGAKTPPSGQIFRHALVNYTFALVTVMLRAKALEAMEGAVFDSRFGFIEEMDVFLRVLHDWEAVYVPEVLAKYRMHDKSWTFSRGMFFPQEKEILIQKLVALYPNFEKEYASELVALRRHIAYEKFLQFWRNGEIKKARAQIRPYALKNLKLTIFLGLSFLSFSAYLKLRKLFGRRYYTI